MLKGLQGKNECKFSMRHTLSSPIKRYKGCWDQTSCSLVSWPKYKEAPYPPDQHEMSSRGTRISTPQYSGESLMQWQKPPEEWRIGMLSKRGSLKRPSTTSRKRVSLHDGLTQSTPLKKPHQGIKKTEEKLTSTCPAKMGNDTPPNGSSEWMGGRWPDTLRMMHQEISPSSLTSLPPKNTTTTTTTTLWEPCQGGSCPSWWVVEIGR